MEASNARSNHAYMHAPQEASPSGYRDIGIPYVHAKRRTWRTRENYRSDRDVRRTFTSSGSGLAILIRALASLDGDKRPRAIDTVGRAFTYVSREILARGVSSRSLNPHSNVRENIARLMIRVTHVGRGCAQTVSQSQPGCLPACLPANPPADGVGCGREETAAI